MKRLLTVAIVGFILYSLMSAENRPYINNMVKKLDHTEEQKSEDTAPQSEEVIKFEGTFLERSLSKILYNTLKTQEGRNFVERLIQPVESSDKNQPLMIDLNIFNPLKQALKIEDLGKGTGPSAICGQIANYRYEVTTQSGIVIEQKNVNLMIGVSSVIPGINDSLVGMQKGGLRTALIPPSHGYSQLPLTSNKFPTTEDLNLKLHLFNIMPNIEIQNVKMFDDVISISKPLSCGRLTNLHIKITNLENKILYDTKLLGKKVTYRIGDHRFPVIYSYALHGKVPVGKRTVIAEGKHFKNLLDSSIPEYLRNKNINPNQLYIIEFYDFDA